MFDRVRSFAAALILLALTGPAAAEPFIEANHDPQIPTLSMRIR